MPVRARIIDGPVGAASQPISKMPVAEPDIGIHQPRKGPLTRRLPIGRPWKIVIFPARIFAKLTLAKSHARDEHQGPGRDNTPTHHTHMTRANHTRCTPRLLLPVQNATAPASSNKQPVTSHIPQLYWRNGSHSTLSQTWFANLSGACLPGAIIDPYRRRVWFSLNWPRETARPRQGDRVLHRPRNSLPRRERCVRIVAGVPGRPFLDRGPRDAHLRFPSLWQYGGGSTHRRQTRFRQGFPERPDERDLDSVPDILSMVGPLWTGPHQHRLVFE